MIALDECNHSRAVCVCVCETELAAETSLCRLKGFINSDGAFLKPQLFKHFVHRQERKGQRQVHLHLLLSDQLQA